jgi:hypothetical protein
MNLPPPKVCRRIAQLHALLGSSSDKEAETARAKLVKELAKHGLSWNDLPEILAAAATISSATGAASRKPSPTPSSAPQVNVLSLVLVLLEKYGVVTDHERMALALWCLHTYVFDRYAITPRLALLSPVRGCGKSTVLDLLDLLIDNAFHFHNPTPAPIYHALDRNPRTTLLLDEGDNLGLFQSGKLRSLFNSGHSRSGSFDRLVGGWPRKFKTFAPLAIAAIGTLPLPLMQRSVIINMQRASAASQIELLDDADPQWSASRNQIRMWEATCRLAPKPDIPSALRHRAADNWRPLIAIGDDLGMGAEARAAAIALNANRPDEDIPVTLLNDLRKVFNALPLPRWGMDRATGAYLVEALLSLEDSCWAEYRGVNDDRPPRKLTQNLLAQLLRPFGIRPKTIWPAQRRPGDHSARGYLYIQFEAAWASYCPEADTPTQSSKIIQLPRS